jgi:hypothetical protein
MAVFGARLLSALTGLAFTLIVTRNLAVAEFGVWQYLSALFSYFAFPAGLLTFWATRLYARGQEVGRTALLGNLALSMPFALAFALAAGPASGIIAADPAYFRLLSLQFPLYYAATMLDALATGRRPQLVGYGIAAFEVAKVALALLAFRALGLGLTGAILSVIGAYAVQAALMARLAGAGALGPGGPRAPEGPICPHLVPAPAIPAVLLSRPWMRSPWPWFPGRRRRWPSTRSPIPWPCSA